MSDDQGLTLFYAPQTRATGSRLLLDEIGVPYRLHILNMKAGEQRGADYLAVNPTGKVPAIRHRGHLVTEQVAISLYLADVFPEAGLAPSIDDPLRGPYLRWMVYFGSAFEPAVVDVATKHSGGEPRMSVYGTFETVIDGICGQLRAGPYLLGERRTAADILWGMGLSWTVGFGLVPQRPEIMAYLDRFRQNPALARLQAADAALAAQHAKDAEIVRQT